MYVHGWKSCPLCGRNIPMVQRRRNERNTMISRPKSCPSCGEQYKVTIAGDFYAEKFEICPDGCVMVFHEEHEGP